MVEKRYYWIQIEKDFFRNKEIKFFKNIAGGDTYTVIYLKMLLKSIDGEGKLFFEGFEKTFAQELALDIDEEEKNVEFVVGYLISKGLLVEHNFEEYELTSFKSMVGSETAAASRMRRMRAKKSVTKLQDVTPEFAPVTERREEKEKRREEKDILSSNLDDVKTIISYLNEKAGTQYRATSKKTQSLVNARFNETFTIDDFKQVIDIKVAEWSNDEKMSKFLRPETLFGPKFESYLNQKPVNKGQGVFADPNAKFDVNDRGGW